MMKNKKTAVISLMLSAVMAVTALTGCETVKKSDLTGGSDPQSIFGGNSNDKDSTTIPVDSYPDYPVSFPAIEQTDTGDVYEAENGSLSEGLTTSSERTNFSGNGYVTGFSGDGSETVVFDVEAPSNQHYDMTFCIASDEIAKCTVYLNESEISHFETTSDGAFTKITLYGVFLVVGSSEVKITVSDADICLDYLKLTNNTSLSEVSYEADGQLSNVNAGESAKELMSFLTENYGDYIIAGQYVSGTENKELELIYRTTGKLPVIRFDALENCGDNFDESFKKIDASAQWHRNGGIVGLMWYWESPGENPSVYAEDTDFRLSDAVTDINIAQLSQEEIRGLYGEGKISEQCYGLILDIDNMSGQLLSLKNKGIPVLWRPLHEASGDWFWWGASDIEDYKWLWELMYERMTEYFGLDNLIWIWNGQSADTLVDKDTFDIACVDIYLSEGKEFKSRYEQFASLQRIVGTDKLIALSECSSVPDIDACFRDNAVWSFFGVWYGKYLMTSEGEYSEKYALKDSLIRAYNSSGVLTLDEYTAMKENPESVQDNTEENTAEASEAETSEETE
ncbi:MAG: glycoside hydrolase [Ruminococcus sp.]|nr:glycoside hydrolase [Ruminococcus sp.]